MPGVLVDGNDLLAMYRATAEGAGRARAGGGPTLIEAVTYRVGPHTTSDDPRRYRSPEEEAEWQQRDPVDRVRRYLAREGGWDEAWQQQIEAEEGADIEAAVEAAEAVPPMAPREIFEGMFAEMTPQLLEQQRELLGELPEEDKG
jgi:pyruvate dehydrogenase E1 component alpha subunit